MVFYYRFKNWCVEHRRDIAFALVIILISSFSFGLGYLANKESVRAPIIIEQYASSTVTR